MSNRDDEGPSVPDHLVRLAVAEITAYAIVLIGLDGRVLTWNKGAEHMFGYDPDEVIGTSFGRLFTPEDVRDGRPDRELRQAASTGSSSDENWLVRKDGSQFWAQGATMAVRGDQGQIEAFVKVVTDFTERRQAQEERAQLLVREEAARAAAEAAEKRLNTVLDSIGDAICALDQQFRFIFANERFRQLMAALPHHPTVDIIGQSLWDVVPQLVGTRFETEVRRVIVDHVPIDFEEYFPPWSVWFEVHCYPTNGGMTAYLRNITRRKLVQERLEAERGRLRAVITYSPVGTILVEGVDGQRIVANHKVEQLLGHPLPAEGGITQFVGQVFLPNGTPRRYADLALVRALHGETVIAEEEILAGPTGQAARVLVSAVPLREHGQIAGAVVVYEDITRLRDLERQREEWVSVVVHDLRQPVAVILGYADMLRITLRQVLTPEAERFLEHLSVAARNLNKMVDDLLEVSHIETGRLTLQRQTVDLLSLVGNVLSRMATVSGDHPIRLEVRGEIPASCVDAARIEQVLSNLLSNAVKYSYPRTDIVVSVERRGDDIVVAVTNRGQGISPDEVGRLFSRFYRTEAARTGTVSGLGLGLYISKGIVEAHGGSIEVESIPSQTTTFRFTLAIVADCPPGEGVRG